ncbi:phage tail protein [Pseudomonas sichuanensis]|uniref:phage tail protein n=1 Tax=Pseudomonas TaxID=286 RepID=UPI0037F10E58
MNAFIGEIRLFPYNYTPQCWVPCLGQKLSVQAYPALFAILSTTYGGDGRVDFCVPDLRNQVPIGAGTAPGLTSRVLGKKVGDSTVTLDSTHLAAHSHRINVQSGLAATGATNEPTTQTMLAQPRTLLSFNPNATAGRTLAPDTLGKAGSAKPTPTPRSTVQPSLAMVYYICVEGDFPVKP